MKSFKTHMLNLIIPLFVFGAIGGSLTCIVVSFYKIAVSHVISLSGKAYSFLGTNMKFMPVVLLLVLPVCVFLSLIYKKLPTLKGGGIPTSVSALRGIISIKWFVNLVGVFFLSLVSFFIGVPLGNEGPSVQMGTAVGKGVASASFKKHRAWERYSMTGGACAGFSAATGSTISAITFAIEEAHQRTSPMIVCVCSVSVIFAGITGEIFSRFFNLPLSLFESYDFITLSLKDIWIPVVLGISVGLFASVFLTLYRYISTFFNKTLEKIPLFIKIFAVFTVTLFLGIYFENCVSTGHHFMLSLFKGGVGIIPLLVILVLRSLLMLCANTNGITGGIFVPLLVLGATVSAIFGEITMAFGLVTGDYFSLVIALGICACIAAMMKMPITAVVFAVEVLGCHKNVLYVIIVCAVSYFISEIFSVQSINDTVVEERIKALSSHSECKTVDTFVTVEEGSFAVGKQIRDIFWPPNLLVLSVSHSQNSTQIRDVGKGLCHGDVLHIRVTTHNWDETQKEVSAIVENIK